MNNSVDVYIDELQFEISFENQRHARKFSSTPPQTWYPMLLQLINDELNQFFVQQSQQSHIQIDVLALSLPELHMANLDNNLQAAIKSSIRETLESISYDTQATVSPLQMAGKSSSPIASWLYNLNDQLRTIESRFASSLNYSEDPTSAKVATEDLIKDAVSSSSSIRVLQALTTRFRQLINQQQYGVIAKCLAPYLSHANDVYLLFDGLYNLSTEQVQKLHKSVKLALEKASRSVTVDKRLLSYWPILEGDTKPTIKDAYYEHNLLASKNQNRLGHQYFSSLLQKLVGENPFNLNQKFVHALVCNASYHLNVFLRSGLDQYQLLRLCQRLDDASLQLICDALCANVALVAPEHAISLCKSQTSRCKALAWRHLIDFIVFEGVDINDTAAIMYVSNELAQLQTHSQASEKELKGGKSLKLLSTEPTESTGGHNQPIPPVNSTAVTPLLNNDPSTFLTLEITQLKALVENRPYKVMLWFETYAALPLVQTLNSAQAFTWSRAKERLMLLIDVFAYLVKQTESITTELRADKNTSTWQHRFKDKDRLLAEQNKAAKLMVQAYQQVLDNRRLQDSKYTSEEIVAFFTYYYSHLSLCQFVNNQAITTFTLSGNMSEELLHWLDQEMDSPLVNVVNQHNSAGSIVADPKHVYKSEQVTVKQLHDEFDLWLQSSPRFFGFVAFRVAPPTWYTVD